jgi:DNA-binding transcriptional regulator YiaG
MPNIANVLKAEIARLARKEVRQAMGSLQKAAAQYRRDIAELKRQVTGLQRRVAVLEGACLDAPPSVPRARKAERVRFSPRSLQAQRRRLGLSAAEYARLAGVSTPSIYSWERGKTRPRQEQLLTLAALRGIGKKEARARLARQADGAQ